MLKYRSLLLLIVSLVCLLVAFLLAVNVFTGSHFDAWLVAGLIAFVAAHLPDNTTP